MLPGFNSDSVNTMRAEIVAYMFYLEGPEFPEYVMHILHRKYSEKGSPSWSCPTNNRKITENIQVFPR